MLGELWVTVKSRHQGQLVPGREQQVGGHLGEAYALYVARVSVGDDELPEGKALRVLDAKRLHDARLQGVVARGSDLHGPRQILCLAAHLENALLRCLVRRLLRVAPLPRELAAPLCGPFLLHVLREGEEKERKGGREAKNPFFALL